MPANPPEKVVQQHVVQLLRSIGADVWVLGTRRAKGDYPGTRQTPGLPDVLACLPTHMAPRWTQEPDGHIYRTDKRVWLAIECKSDTGRLRPEQQHFRQCCHDSDMLHVTGGLDDVIAKLVQLGYLKAESVAHYRRPEAVLK